MRCHKCVREITAPQRKTAYMERDANGKLKATYHRKCWKVELKDRQTTGSHAGGRYLPGVTPGAYDMATGKGVKHKEDLSQEEALAKRQEEIAEQRALEDTPGRWDDYRDPLTVEI